MSDRIVKLAPEILGAIQKANKILLHFHPLPDLDSVGSVLAMNFALERMGKKITVIAGDSELPKVMAFLPGFDKVSPKNYFQITPADYDLFLILDSSSPDMISQQGEVKFPDNLNTVVIDHHASNQGFGQINLIEPSYPATAQVIFDLLKVWQINITPEIARYLMLGLYTDTGGFQYLPNNPSYSFEVAKELSQIYPEFPKDIFVLDNNNDPERLMFEGLALNLIETYFNNRVAISAVSLTALESRNINPTQTENGNISNKLTSVTNWEIGISLIERVKDEVSVSIRTRDARKFDASKLASSLDGGGHPAAAGALIKKPFEEAKQLLLDSIKICYPEL